MKFKRILFPVDFSEHAQESLGKASQFLSGDELQEVHLLYVLHTPTDYSTWSGDPTTDVRHRLDSIGGGIDLPGHVALKTWVGEGHPSTVICDYAVKHGCDLIIIATHGRTGLKHMMMGSTAEQVVRHAACPVLTLRVVPSR